MMDIEQNVDFGDSELSVREVSQENKISNICLILHLFQIISRFDFFFGWLIHFTMYLGILLYLDA
jgi:hypothetical protein